MWIYEIETGEIKRDGKLVGLNGYSGNGDGLNNPRMTDVKNVGPIPQGLYTIGKAATNKKLGPVVMALTPDPANVMHGRSAFYIHGDNKDMNHTASEGCIIYPRMTREVIALSWDRQLKVI